MFQYLLKEQNVRHQGAGEVRYRTDDDLSSGEKRAYGGSMLLGIVVKSYRPLRRVLLIT